ncbi:MAG TPA: enoyl-CoA hydratase/isomerase family protein, partial [Pyrinomonadaceae bacterium]|nr:enoyl-CoA hydratase/isomerase family protein [Pyrinomonadaceae bacterium]
IGTAMILRFTRPEIRNPLSVSVLDALTDVVLSLDENVGALILTGSDDVFASGADLREIAGVTGETAAEFAKRGQRLMNTIAMLQAKTIAAVNGYCYGGALDLTLACDSRIASPNAEFCHPGGGLGIMTGWGGTQRLPRLVGEAAALELFLTGKRVSADEALRMGLIDQIAADPLTAAIDSCP